MQDICHRDIKPPNILIGMDEHVRICDFGSSKRISKEMMWAKATLQGTPQFLSPKQRVHLNTFLSTGELVKVEHDAYKSDVFSLGYTFLILSLLEDTKCGQILNNMAQNISNEVNRLTLYSLEYQQMILWMMCIEEENRPDFRALRDYLRPRFEPQYYTIPQQEYPAFDTGLTPVDMTPSAPVQQEPGCVMYSWHKLEDTAVTLPCNKHHRFCTKRCLAEYVFNETRQYAKELNAVTCPSCKQQIPKEMIYEAFGGEQEFIGARLKIVGVCSHCDGESLENPRYMCEHRMCKKCKAKSKSQKCPTCKADLNPNRHKRCILF